jgi:hypothetical protein
MIQAVHDKTDNNTTANHTHRFHLPAGVFRRRYIYEPETGRLIRRRTGRPVGSKNGRAGLLTEMRGNGVRYQYYVHRIIVYMQTGNDPVGYAVLHVDGNNENNVFTNLTGDWLRNEQPEGGRVSEKTIKSVHVVK